MDFSTILDALKKLVPILIEYKYQLAIGILLLSCFVLYIQRNACQSVQKTLLKNEEFSNDEIYSYKSIQKSDHQIAELTATDDALVSAIARRSVHPDGSVDIDISADLYLLNKNVFGETTKQAYHAVASSKDGANVKQLGKLIEEKDQVHKLKMTVDDTFLPLEKISIFHVVDGADPRLIISGDLK